jgi:hypothetical protein
VSGQSGLRRDARYRDDARRAKLRKKRIADVDVWARQTLVSSFWGRVVRKSLLKGLGHENEPLSRWRDWRVTVTSRCRVGEIGGSQLRAVVALARLAGHSYESASRWRDWRVTVTSRCRVGEIGGSQLRAVVALARVAGQDHEPASWRQDELVRKASRSRGGKNRGNRLRQLDPGDDNAVENLDLGVDLAQFPNQKADAIRRRSAMAASSKSANGNSRACLKIVALSATTST